MVHIGWQASQRACVSVLVGVRQMFLLKFRGGRKHPRTRPARNVAPYFVTLSLHTTTVCRVVGGAIQSEGAKGGMAATYPLGMSDLSVKL